MEIFIKLLDPKARIPKKMSVLAAGYDIYACLNTDVMLQPMQRVIIPTGFALVLPKLFEAQIRPRSGLAINNGITVLNSPGTIDADYRGEVKIILINLSNEAFRIKNEMRIAQMVIAKHEELDFYLVKDLDITKRGEGGFGSSLH